MKDTRFDTRTSEWAGDLTVWLRENSENNDLQLERMRRNLRMARQRELTPRQQEILSLYYDDRLTISQIARRLGINTSTVCRTLERARERLRRSLRYSL